MLSFEIEPRPDSPDRATHVGTFDAVTHDITASRSQDELGASRSVESRSCHQEAEVGPAVGDAVAAGSGKRTVRVGMVRLPR
jgi:hypothetical protein